MKEIPTSQAHLIRPIFQNIPHNAAVVFSLIEGNTPGRIFVDRPEAPQSALIFPENAFFYIGGDFTNTGFSQAAIQVIFDEILPYAEEKEMVLFSFSEDWRKILDELLAEKGAITIYRKIFRFNPEKFAIHKGQQDRLPSGFVMRPIDWPLAERYPAYWPLVAPDSVRFGICLMQGEQVVSECTSIFVGHGEAEIDISTHENFQGQGLATLTATAFIEECLARGLQPSWSCWTERQASWKLALKLGFDELPDAPAHLWVENL